MGVLLKVKGKPVEKKNDGSRKFLDRREDLERRTFDPSSYVGIEKRQTEDRRETERRKHRRLKPNKLTFIKLSSGNEDEMGQLLNISEGGLSFRYFEDAEKTITYSNLDILSSDADFYVARIPFRTTSSDTNMSFSPYFRPRNPIELRQHGVAFEDLTPDQISRLDYFLSNYTLGEA